MTTSVAPGPTRTAPGAGLHAADLLRAGIDVIKRNPITILVPILLVSMLTVGGNSYDGRADEFPDDPRVLLPLFAFLGMMSIVVGVLLFFVNATVWLMVSRAALAEALRGERITIGDAFEAIRPKILGGTGTFLLVVLAMVGGFIALVVPGFIVLAGLFPWAVVVVAEGKTGTEALRRTWQITKGHKGDLFLVLLAGFLAAALAGVVLGWLPAVGPGLAGAASGVSMAWMASAAAVFYARRVGAPGARLPPVESLPRV